MTTRINYTGRQRLTRDRVSIRARESGDQVLLDGTIDLSGLEFPDDARLVLEAYRRTSYERIDLGTASQLQSQVAERLSLFSSADSILFRVKVVGTGGADHGRLLAVADRLRPESTEEGAGRSPLLPFESSRDLGQELWKLVFYEDGPTVLINVEVEDWKALARSRHFRGLVLPELARQIARWVAPQWEDAADADDHAAGRWVQFFRSLGVDTPEVSNGEGDNEGWADEAAAMFARRNEFLGTWLRLEEEDRG